MGSEVRFPSSGLAEKVVLSADLRGVNGSQFANSQACGFALVPHARNDSSWYVAQVLSQKEGYAAAQLERQGFQTFFPKFHRQRRRARKIETVQASLFPGYIFVKFDIKKDRWLAVNSTRGVVRLVGPRSSEPQRAPLSIVEYLKARCESGVLNKLSDNIKPGDRIQINAGALAGQIAIIESLNDQKRISVLLSLLGTQHSVLIDADQLAPAAVT